MDIELTTWLDMVWEALSEDDKRTRGVQLEKAQTFLENTQQCLSTGDETHIA